MPALSPWCRAHGRRGVPPSFFFLSYNHQLFFLSVYRMPNKKTKGFRRCRPGVRAPSTQQKQPNRSAKRKIWTEEQSYFCFCGWSMSKAGTNFLLARHVIFTLPSHTSEEQLQECTCVPFVDDLCLLPTRRVPVHAASSEVKRECYTLVPRPIHFK